MSISLLRHHICLMQLFFGIVDNSLEKYKMAFTSLRLQQFRSYADALFTFDKGVNIVVGPNASGKTNILEGILLAARGSSYRAKDAELIRISAHWARIDAAADDHMRVVK